MFFCKFFLVMVFSMSLALALSSCARLPSSVVSLGKNQDNKGLVLTTPPLKTLIYQGVKPDSADSTPCQLALSAFFKGQPIAQMFELEYHGNKPETSFVSLYYYIYSTNREEYFPLESPLNPKKTLVLTSAFLREEEKSDLPLKLPDDPNEWLDLKYKKMGLKQHVNILFKAETQQQHFNNLWESVGETDSSLNLEDFDFLDSLEVSMYHVNHDDHVSCKNLKPLKWTDQTFNLRISGGENSSPEQ